MPKRDKDNKVDWQQLLSWGSPVGTGIWLVLVGLFLFLLHLAGLVG